MREPLSIDTIYTVSPITFEDSLFIVKSFSDNIKINSCFDTITTLSGRRILEIGTIQNVEGKILLVEIEIQSL